MHTIIIDELNKVKSKDIQQYFLRYFNKDEMNNIAYIARYKSTKLWHCGLSISNRIIYGNTLKDLVINLLTDENCLNELVGGSNYEEDNMGRVR